MAETQGIPSTIRGKTFAVVRSPGDDSASEEAARLIASLGGEVIAEVTPRLNYLVVLHRRPDRPSKEERQANTRHHGAAPIQFLDLAGYRDLLSPTPEEALALLRGGEEGLAQWRRRRNDQARVPIDLSGVNLRGARLTDIILYRVKLDGADL